MGTKRWDDGALTLSFETTGDQGDPLVLVHGGWDDASGWDLVVPGLATALQVLAYDRRGHGGSTGRPRGRPLRDDTADLARLLESTQLFPAHLVGQGYGGAVALRLAVDRPELVRSVIAHELPFVGLLSAASSGSLSGASVPQRLGEVRALVGTGSPELAARRYLALFAAPGEQWGELDGPTRGVLLRNARPWAEEMADPEALHPPVAELREVDVPVLLTAGGRSPAFSSEIHALLAEELPNATAVALREAGHFVHRTDPDLFAGVVGTFLLERNVPST